MRVLVEADGLAFAPRMLLAAWGLAERGHAVRWRGATLPPGAAMERAPEPLRRIAGLRDAGPIDVVIGAGDRIASVAFSALRLACRAVVLDLGSTAEAWGPVRRLIWESLDARGIHAPVRDGGSRWPLEPERLAAWDDLPVPAEPDAAHADTELLELTCERVVASRRGPRPAVFLDRDGTLVIERGYLSHADDLELLPGVAEALRALSSAGYALVVVSNQSGVGRGLFPLSRVYEAMARLRVLLRRSGVELDGVRFCPHRPDAGCACRKPLPELLRQAARDLLLVLPESAMVGDKLLDPETGRAAGARGVLVRSGYGRDEERRLLDRDARSQPSLVADDLPSTVPWLIDQHPGMR